MKPKVLVFSGYGIHSEEETKCCFELFGAKADIVHINDIIDGYFVLGKYQILAFPGGFSYGDDTGAGNAYAHKLKNHLWDGIQKFINGDKLVIGICNGFQILVNLGLIPALERNYGQVQAALLPNSTARLICRWVDMKVSAKSPWLVGMDTFSAPIAHGEGKFYATEENLEKLRQRKLIALKYTKGKMSTYLGYTANPNGSTEDIAGIIDESGKILGMMPHPERGIYAFQRPDWGMIKEKCKCLGEKYPLYSDSAQIFKNAVNYFLH